MESSLLNNEVAAAESQGKSKVAATDVVESAALGDTEMTGE